MQESLRLLHQFLDANDRWIIEGRYSSRAAKRSSVMRSTNSLAISGVMRARRFSKKYCSASLSSLLKILKKLSRWTCSAFLVKGIYPGCRLRNKRCRHKGRIPQPLRLCFETCYLPLAAALNYFRNNHRNRMVGCDRWQL
jgi:hypothetical protein